MLASVRDFHARLIDYAGLFPPAQLPLAQAVADYGSYRQGPDAWMLGRFIVPAQRLCELDEFAHAWGQGEPWAFAVLGTGAASTESLRKDGESIAAFRQRYAGRVVVDAFEVKAAADASASLAFPTGTTVFVEGGVELLGRWGPGVGGKLRCGGIEVAAFPAAEQVARFLVACRHAGVPFKATAGLHHPFRQRDARLGVTMHGFVNVYAAGILGHAHELDQATVARIVADDDRSAFRFTPDGLYWRDWFVDVAAIARLRCDRVTSFGSCSFDEPRDDLRSLHLLP